jgi:hypothetical protein
MIPDDNLPTIPGNKPAPPPQGVSKGGYDWFDNDDVMPMPSPVNAPPATNDGRPPVWDMPQAPKPQGKSSNMHGFGLGFAIALIILGGMALILIAVLVFNQKDNENLASLQQSPTPVNTATLNRPSPTATSLPQIQPNDAQDRVNQFYTLINGQQYQDAYNLFSSDYRKSHPFNQFQSSWQGILQIQIDPASYNVTTAANGRSATVTLTYMQTLENMQTRYKQATVGVAYENGQLVITQISTKNASPPPTDVPTDTPTPEGSPTFSP